MAKPQRSLAQLVLKVYGPETCREYVKRPVDGCTLYRCEAGHDNCAHIKRGPCLKELTEIIEALS